MSADSTTPVSGGCLCGAVRYTANAKSLHVDTCHCSMCRKWTAGPMFALDCGGSVKVENPDALGVYRSSDWAERCFCKTCGTSLFYRLVDKPFYAVSAETVDNNDGFVLTTQIFVDEKPAYYEFANKTKMMTGADVIAAFSAADAGGQHS
ncbi:MAG: GFA family protein [Pseudomonadota bacterium]|jgi:hypothetical protein